jgi:hypothetical protein
MEKKKTHLPFRQIHADFHTSELIADVGSEFDAGAFAEMLADAHVDSITCFARCHHGYMYYDSALYPERIHPTLADRHLLKHQVEACHAKNIRVCAYTTVQWDHYTS